MRVLITGGCGFIGSALIRHLLTATDWQLLNIDKLTYAGHLSTVAPVTHHERYRFLRADICDQAAISAAFSQFRPDAVLHLAAESHVDRSIDGPLAFVHTNVAGTAVLLDAARNYLRAAPQATRSRFRFLHVSTDEVFGSLGWEGCFTESSPYDPRSPYSASKAAADHLVRAWHHTYQLPTIITNCSNNYGPFQFPEKLIPVVILKALSGDAIPVYGRGRNVRDWLFVDDHVRALALVLEQGRAGRTYNVGGNSERTNLQVVHAVCDLVDELAPQATSRRELIRFVADRPGHDLRYAIDATRLRTELGWSPQETFATGLRKTVRWYLDHLSWCNDVTGNDTALERRGLAEVLS